MPTNEDKELVQNAKDDFLASQNDLLTAWGEAKARCGVVNYSDLSPSLWALSNKLIDRNDSSSEAVILNNWIADFEQYDQPSAADIVDRINGDVQAINNAYTQVISLVCPAVNGTASVDSGSGSGVGSAGRVVTGGSGSRSGTTGNGGNVIPPIPKPVTAGMGSFGWLALLGLLGYIVYEKYAKKPIKKMAAQRRSTKRTKRLKPVKRSYYPKLVSRIKRSSSSRRA